MDRKKWGREHRLGPVLPTLIAIYPAAHLSGREQNQHHTRLRLRPAHEVSSPAQACTWTCLFSFYLEAAEIAVSASTSEATRSNILM